MGKICVRKIDDVVVPFDCGVIMYYTSSFIQITYLETGHNNCSPRASPIISEKNIENVCEYRSINSLRKTFSKLSLLIRSNFVGGKSELFIGLTYKDFLSDNQRLRADIKNLGNRIKRIFKDVSIRCLMILEYQSRGCPHIHIILKRLDNQSLKPYEEKISNVWQFGTVDIQRTYDIDKLADYLNPFKTIKKKECLKYYEKCMQIYHCIGDFERPKKEILRYDEAIQLINRMNYRIYRDESYEIIDKEGNEINKVKKVFLNKGVVKNEKN